MYTIKTVVYQTTDTVLQTNKNYTYKHPTVMRTT